MGERKLVQAVRKRSATDLDAKLVTRGEVRQAQTPRRMDLREIDVTLGTMQGTPLTHSTLQGCSMFVSYWPGWRRCSSSNNVTALSKAWVCNSGRTSASQTPDSGSSRVRQLRASRWEGKASMRSALRSLLPARAAAATCVSVLQSCFYVRI
jgi:hypothetical protein